MTETSLQLEEAHLQETPEFRKPTNSERRSREYLDEDEIKRLLASARKSPRHPARNHALILTSYIHGLRVSEASGLRWRDVDLQGGRIHIQRLKGSNSGTHPARSDELRALRKLEKVKQSPYVFESIRGGQLTVSGIRQLVAQLGRDAGFDFPLHPHQLRHSCGYYLANRGFDTRFIQEWLGHKSIACTVIYTQLSPNRFEGIFEE